MKFHRFQTTAALVSALLVPGFASAANDPHNYPTQTRIEFVLECIQTHGGAHEYIYKCSCLMDEITQKLTHDEFVDMSSIARYSQLGGEKGGVFRDSDDMKDARKKYLGIVKAGEKSCLFK